MMRLFICKIQKQIQEQMPQISSSFRRGSLQGFNVDGIRNHHSPHVKSPAKALSRQLQTVSLTAARQVHRDIFEIRPPQLRLWF